MKSGVPPFQTPWSFLTHGLREREEKTSHGRCIVRVEGWRGPSSSFSCEGSSVLLHLMVGRLSGSVDLWLVGSQLVLDSRGSHYFTTSEFAASELVLVDGQSPWLVLTQSLRGCEGKMSRGQCIVRVEGWRGVEESRTSRRFKRDGDDVVPARTNIEAFSQGSETKVRHPCSLSEATSASRWQILLSRLERLPIGPAITWTGSGPLASSRWSAAGSPARGIRGSQQLLPVRGEKRRWRERKRLTSTAIDLHARSFKLAASAAIKFPDSDVTLRRKVRSGFKMQMVAMRSCISKCNWWHTC
ncbi:hypothetical protein B0H11DRAFT_2348706 [Mycena galericulata]|nr:hypothetical protein B0H11DRAFT_2348706 [Mycena galericulata]